MTGKNATRASKVELKSNWDHEDVDENEIKDSWEDDDDDEPVLAHPIKAASKAIENKCKEAKVPKDFPKEEPFDPIAEKLRMQRLVEEADYHATAELFGTKGEEKSFEIIIPKSESDFLEYAEMISHKLKPYEKSYHYIALLKAVMRLSVTNMKAAEITKADDDLVAGSYDAMDDFDFM
ncbi:hypothetical protein Bca101_020188 [Brassica carinata]